MNRVLAILQHQVLPAAVCFGVALALMQTDLLQRVENVVRDQGTALRLEATVPAPDVVLVGIDDTSIHDIGRWPWDREVHGDFLQLLARARPAVVSWDILFTEPTPGDDYLARCILANRSVVLGAMRSGDPEEGMSAGAAAKAGAQLQPLPHVEGDRRQIASDVAMLLPTGKLMQVARIGFVDAPPDKDGVLRRVPLVVRIGDQVYPSLALRTVMEYWSVKPEGVTVRLGDAIIIDAPLAHRRIPIDESGAYAINYRHDRDGFTAYGYSSTLVALEKRFADHTPQPIPPVSGRILLVGQVAEGLSDFGPTPFSNHTPLVLVHTNAIENILLQDYLHPVSVPLVWVAAFLIGVVGVARLSERKPVEQALFALGIPVAFLIAAMAAWVNGSYVMPIVGPLLGFGALQIFVIGRRMIAELRAKERIKGMFGAYVSPELVKRMVASGQQPELGGHTEEITAYFSDIERFSTFSEILQPPELVTLMNEYLTACTDIVQGEGGTLDKYIGDAIVAMFGAPVSLQDHAYRACLAGIRVQQTMEELRARWAADERWPEIVRRMRTRIGLNSGPCVIGNMGSRTRFNYTMMGDNVNLAARMESGAKLFGTYLMCTDATRAACVEHGGDSIVFRSLGQIQVMGRAAAVPIFEIVGTRDTLSAATQECHALFARGLERYAAHDWDGAESLFRQSAALEPLTPERTPGIKSNPSLAYLGIVRQTRTESLPADWHGVYVMKEK